MGKVAFIFMSFSLVILPALGLWQFIHFQDLGDYDHAWYVSALWNMAHGSAYSSMNDSNFFGIHSQYLGLVWVPIEALAGAIGLKIGMYLCILAGSVLAMRRLSGFPEIAGFGIATILLSPPVASQFFNGFHIEFIAIPILVMALDAYREKKLYHFLLCTAALAFSKEVFTLAIGGLLLVALVERRTWKWILLPGLLCCIQMGFYRFAVLPQFTPKGNIMISYLPSSFSQILDQWFSTNTLYFVFHLTLPFLPLMLALPKRYLLIPLPLIMFYLAFPDPVFQSMGSHYSLPLVFLCLSGWILSMDDKRIAALRNNTTLPFSGIKKQVFGKIFFACAVTGILCYPIWRPNFSIPAANFDRVRDVREIRSLVPSKASVIISAPFTSLFAGRKTASEWMKRTAPIQDFDYIILDGTFTQEYHIYRKDLDRNISGLLDSPDWKPVFAKHDLYLFQNARMKNILH